MNNFFCTVHIFFGHFFSTSSSNIVLGHDMTSVVEPILEYSSHLLFVLSSVQLFPLQNRCALFACHWQVVFRLLNVSYRHMSNQICYSQIVLLHSLYFESLQFAEYLLSLKKYVDIFNTNLVVLFAHS